MAFFEKQFRQNLRGLKTLGGGILLQEMRRLNSDLVAVLTVRMTRLIVDTAAASTRLITLTLYRADNAVTVAQPHTTIIQDNLR